MKRHTILALVSRFHGGLVVALRPLHQRRQALWAVGKYVIGFAVLAWVIWHNWEPPPGTAGPGLSEALKHPINFGAASVAAVLFCVSVLLTFYRWFILVRAQDLPLSAFEAVRLGSFGFFCSNFLPSSIGGDILKAIVVARGQKRRTVAVATVLIDRALGLWGSVWVVVILGLIFYALGNQLLHENASLKIILWICCAVIATSMLAWCVLLFLPTARAEALSQSLERIPTVGHSLAEIWRAVWMYRLKQQYLFFALAVSIASQIGFVLTFNFAAHVFFGTGSPDAIPTLSEHFLIVPVGLAVQALFPSPGGIGAGEYGFGKLYTLVGKSEAAGVLASLALRIIVWGWSAIGFLFYASTKSAHAREESSEPALPSP